MERSDEAYPKEHSQREVRGMKMRRLISLALCFLMVFMLCQPAFADASVCEIDGTGYPTLDAALAVVGDGQTIKLLEDIAYVGCLVIEDKNITFDLNGHDLNVDNPLTDGSDEERTGLYVKGNASVALEGMGEFNVTANKYGVLVDGSTGGSAKATVTNASATGNDGRAAFALGENAELTVEGDATATGVGGIGAEATSKGLVKVEGNVTADGGHAFDPEGDYEHAAVAAWSGGMVIVKGNVTATGSKNIGVLAAGSAVGSYVIVEGNVTGDLGGAYATASATIRIGGNVSATGSLGFGVLATDDCYVEIGGNVTADEVGAWINIGLESDEPSDITIDGIINAPNYIQINVESDETLFEFVDGQPYEGYLRYVFGENRVAVAEFAGGVGHEDDPYLVAHAYHLYNVRNHHHSYNFFRQIEDISLIYFVSVSGWEPIGTKSEPFAGSYDGDGHTISNLFIDRITEPRIGLFGYTGDSADIRDISLEDVRVTGDFYVGGLVGENYGQITNSNVTGSITGRGEIGGLAGINYGLITDSWASGTMTDVWSGSAGGLVGENFGTISNCHAEAAVTSESSFVGGLVGYNYPEGIIKTSYAAGSVEGSSYVGGLVGVNNEGSIDQSYATGTVRGTEDWTDSTYAGGLVGYNYRGSISDSYARGAVSGQEDIGGLVGCNLDIGSITNSYSTGAVSGDSYIGGLVGYNFSEGIITDSYWDMETSQQDYSDGGTGKNTAAMKQQATYEEWDFDTTWDITGSDNDGYPFLRWQVNEVTPTAPTAPRNFTATPGDGRVAISWIAPASNGGSAIIRYEVSSDNSETWVTAGTSTSYTFTGLTNGTTYTFKVRAVNEVGEGAEASATATPKAAPASGGGGIPSTPAYLAYVKPGSRPETTLHVAVDQYAGVAFVDTGSHGLDKEGTVVTIPSIPGVNTYSVGVSVMDLSTTGVQGTLTVNTDTGSIIVPSNMLTGTEGADGDKVRLSIGEGDRSALPDHVRAAIGDKPLIRLMLSIDGKQTGWSNLYAPVTVSIPYTPAGAELANLESIVVWYIDGSGNVVTIPNGHYDQATGMVTFNTTHFGDFAVAYNPVTFNDVPSDAWYCKAVSFIAARGITNGTGNGNYSPAAKLTRGEFIVLLMRAYGIAPETNPADNFSDAGNTYYTGYLAAAKRLGISAGVGNNMYAPAKEITRQEMFTLLYNALKVIGQLPQGDSGKTLLDFADASQVALWAQEAISSLVSTGMVAGSGGKLNPEGTSTRAEMAQVLFNLLVNNK